MSNSAGARSGAEHVYDALNEAGVDLLVEVPGHQSIPLDLLLDEREEITGVCARHETAIPHIAWGYHEAGGGIAATMSVPGPGDTNCMHGLNNALVDRVPVVHLTADVDPKHRGRGAIHELDPAALDPVVKANEIVTNPNDLPRALAVGLGAAVSDPSGPVRFSIPAGCLESEISGRVELEPERLTYDADTSVEEAVNVLAGAERPVVFVDNGLRRSSGGAAAVRDLVRSLDIPAVSSYKGAGIIPGDDPRYLGTTGLALQPAGRRVLEAADVVLALGAYFDGPSTGFWSLPMGDLLIHVTAEPERLDVSYEADVGVTADVGEATRALAERVDGPLGWDGTRIGRAAAEERRHHFESLDLYAERSPAPSAGVFRALGEVAPPETIAAIDIGNFRAWALLEFEFQEPESVITPGYWTGMGVGLPGAIGAKLARPDLPVLAIVGDGCLMMALQELHTAAEYDLDVITVVLNNADYNIISRESELRDAVGPRRFGWDSPDFAAIAEGFGCVGLNAGSPGEAAEALEEALAIDSPTLIDIDITPDEMSPREALDYTTSITLS